jgi:hypothetical protein
MTPIPDRFAEYFNTMSFWRPLLRCNKQNSLQPALPPVTPMENPPSPYLLLFRNSGPETHQHLSPEQRQQLVVRWNAWYDQLAAAGQAIEGQPLELATRLVSGPAGSRIVDGPFSEAKEAVGGYVKLLVGSLDEATAIAQRHPGLDYGLIIEVRAMQSTCHLGVTAGHHA